MLNYENRNKLGRPKGSKNFATAEIRKSFKLLIEDNVAQLSEDLKKMSPKDRFNSIVALAKFVLPQLNSVDVTTNIESSFKPVEIYFNDDESK